MAKRELLLNESTTRRFMKLANIPALTNSFLTEQSSVYEEGEEEPDDGAAWPDDGLRRWRRRRLRLWP
jgi:hypothetical protein